MKNESVDYTTKLNYSKLVTNLLKDLIKKYPLFTDKNIHLLNFDIEGFLIHQFPKLTPKILLRFNDIGEDKVVLSVIPRDMLTFLCLSYDPNEMDKIYVLDDKNTQLLNSDMKSILKEDNIDELINFGLFKINSDIYLFTFDKKLKTPMVANLFDDNNEPKMIFSDKISLFPSPSPITSIVPEKFKWTSLKNIVL